MIIRCLFAAMLHLLFVTSAGALTIDDFSAGPIDVTLVESSPYLNLNQVGLPETAVVGGVRTGGTGLDEPILPGDETRVTIDTDAGTFRIASNAGNEGYSLRYGFGPDLALDLDLSALNAFRIDVIEATNSGRASLYLSSGVNEVPLHKSVFIQFMISPNSTPYSIIVPFAGLFDFVDFADIDFIKFASAGAAGSDLTLGGIFAVPEPSSATLFFVALVSMMNFKRRGRS